MASNFTYSATVPDSRDIDNTTGSCPPHALEIAARDGGVILQIFPKSPHDGANLPEPYVLFFNAKEARELIKGIQNAIDCYDQSINYHEDRVRGGVV